MKKRFIAVMLAAVLFGGCQQAVNGNKDIGESFPDTTENLQSEEETELMQEEKNERYIYERVAVIGIDGAGAFFKDTDTPNCDRIFENGATNYSVLTSNPTISAECWGSMLIGVTPEAHRLTNSIVSSRPYDTESAYPSIFRAVREVYPDAPLGAFSEWSPINSGIIEQNINVHLDGGSGENLVKKICDYVSESKPKLLFVQIDEVDGAGHGNGYGTKAHLDDITKVDGYIGKIYDTYAEAGLLDGTLFIVTADHGGTPGGSHGGWTDAEKYVFYGAAGKTVQSGTIGDMEIRDNAAVVLYALGVDPTESWTARVPSGLFEGVEAIERPVFTIEYAYPHRTHESSATPDAAELSKSLDSERIIAYLPFDGNDTPVKAGDGISTSTTGKLYYTDGYYSSGAKFDDAFVTLEGFVPDKDSFTVAMWVKTGGVSGDPVLISNKDWNNGSNKGFVLSLRPGDVKFNFGDGSNRLDVENQLPLDYKDGWVHVIMSVDRENNTVKHYYDFKECSETKLTEVFSSKSFNGLKNVNIGNDGTGKYTSGLNAVLDEVIVYSGAITEDEITALKEHYLK